MTDNLSGVVESLLADFLANEQKQRAAVFDDYRRRVVVPPIVKTWENPSAPWPAKAIGSSPRWTNC